MRTLPIFLGLLLILGGCNRRSALPTVTIDYGGPVSLDVQSFGGDVLLNVDPAAKNLSVTFVRESVHGPMRDKEAKASLEEIDCSAELEIGVGLNRILKVRTSTRHAEPHFQRAHIRITVPDADGIDIHSLLDVEDVIWVARRSRSVVYWIELREGDQAGSVTSHWRDNESALESLAWEMRLSMSLGPSWPKERAPGSTDVWSTTRGSPRTSWLCR